MSDPLPSIESNQKLRSVVFQEASDELNDAVQMLSSLYSELYNGEASPDDSYVSALPASACHMLEVAPAIMRDNAHRIRELTQSLRNMMLYA